MDSPTTYTLTLNGNRQDYTPVQPFAGPRRRLIEALANRASRPGSNQEGVALMLAAVGLCHPVQPAPWGRLRDYDHDLIDFGDAVEHHLEQLGVDDEELVEASRVCMTLITGIETRNQEIEEAADFSRAPAVQSI